ncbi:MAG: acyltransferase [Prevotella sp.]
MGQQWQGKTDGNRWMQQQLINCFRFLNLRIYYAGVACVVPFYMLFRPGFKHSYRFCRQRIGKGPLAALWLSYKNHYRFGQVVIDRFACYAGKHFDITIDNFDRFQKLAQGEPSFMMLSAHVGNYEIAGYNLVTEHKTIYALVFEGETATVMENRRIQFGRTHIEMVPIGKDMAHLFTINNALRDGDIVSMPADRINGSERTVECCFFDGVADFPAGPFNVIVQREVPALPIFVIKTGVSHYHIYIEQLVMPPADMPRKDRVNNLAQQYADIVERIVRKHPEQWFNFFDFFKS